MAAEQVSYDRDVRPILSNKCYQCHGPDSEHREADLRLDLEAAMRAVVVPGDVDASELIARVLSEDVELVMPPPQAKKDLTAEELEILQAWVAQGAVWTRHWAFSEIEAPPVPVARSGCVNPIDTFVHQRLAAEGLSPSPPASRSKLIRRVTYDLTGLPPTLMEVDDFLLDASENAYERVVDRLLASQHFGERMAVMWMDAARYGDTSVYHADGPRDMWAWRDAVIKAYNQNMPFDRFSKAQLAGDLLPEASLDEQVLAGFNRNNGTTDEGGAIAEEYRVEYAVDRVKTTSTVWLGLTMECAQCHDHKYDPISQEDYYRFYAFFNASADGGMQTRNGNAEPTLAIPDPAKELLLPDAERELAKAQSELEQYVASNANAFTDWLTAQEAELGETPLVPAAGVLSINFTEGKGKRVANSAGVNVGQIKGKAEWIDTPHDKGLSFSGSNYVDFGDVGNFERSDAFSYGGWIKADQATGAVLARMDDANSYRGYDLYVSGGAISVHLIHRWPDNAIKVTTKRKLEPGTWHHVLATYAASSTAQGIKIYVDGEPWDWNIEQDGLTDTIRTDKSFLVGSRHPGSRFQGQVDSVQVYDRALNAQEAQALANADTTRSILSIAAKDRTEAQLQTLREHFLNSEGEEYRSLEAVLSERKSRVAELKKPLTTVMIMRDMEQPRETFVLHRGAYDSPTDRRVEPGTPNILPQMSAEAPRNRLGLAEWLFDVEHPLTARVAVNRYWLMLFGKGLVTTPEDFGSQGSYPSHPELLDWLAEDFRSHGWNIKRTIKQIVMSATYRQNSVVSREAYQKDPDNRWLGRGPRFRLQAEFIRDTALSVSELLHHEIGGPGVKPYQPTGLWAEVGLGGNPKFSQDSGEKLYRRSLYTYWKRSAPPPTMQIFDAPTREKCTIRRARTNTPLQALVVLNDPQYVEAARNFAQRVLSKPLDSDVDRVVNAFRLATGAGPASLKLMPCCMCYRAVVPISRGRPLELMSY